jgi:uncharacterized membrane protein
MTAVGLVIMADTELKEKYIWTTTVFLSIQFVALILYMSIVYELKGLSIIIIVMLVSGYLIEYTGIKTGYPFGEYFYTEKLQPQLFNIPVAISLSWVIIVVSSFLIVFSNDSKNLFANIAYSSFLVLGLDLMLEPFASFINSFWVWRAGFVPIQNYVSWFAVAVIFSTLLNRLLRKKSIKADRSSFLINYTPYIILSINVIQFSLINLMNAHYLSTLSGLILITLIIFIKKRGTFEV